jgi:hypothetical protein
MRSLRSEAAPHFVLTTTGRQGGFDRYRVAFFGLKLVF